MDIIIRTSDPESINVAEIRQALEDLNYFVGEIVVEDRGL